MHPLDEFLKRCPSGIWKWPDGSERLDFGSYGISERATGDIYAISSGSKRWALIELPNSCLKRHECKYCGRRGRRGFIYEECPLIAAMRVIVASKLGPEVEIPGALL